MNIVYVVIYADDKVNHFRNHVLEHHLLRYEKENTCPNSIDNVPMEILTKCYDTNDYLDIPYRGYVKKFDKKEILNLLCCSGLCNEHTLLPLRLPKRKTENVYNINTAMKQLFECDPFLYNVEKTNGTIKVSDFNKMTLRFDNSYILGHIMKNIRNLSII